MKPTVEQLKDEIRLIERALKMIELELTKRPSSHSHDLDDETARLESHLEARQRRLRTLKAEQTVSAITAAGHAAGWI